jgi:hypothetical protein
MSFFSDIRKALFTPKVVVSTERPLSKKELNDVSKKELIDNLKKELIDVLNDQLNEAVPFKPLLFNVEKIEYFDPTITQVMFIDSFMKNIIKNITQDIILDIRFRVSIPPKTGEKRPDKIYFEEIRHFLHVQTNTTTNTNSHIIYLFNNGKQITDTDKEYKESLMKAINDKYTHRKCNFTNFQYRILNIEENIEGDDIIDTKDNSDNLQPIITYKLFNILLSDSFFKLLENTREEYNNEILKNEEHFFFKIKINCPKYEVTALRELNTLSDGKFFEYDKTSLWDKHPDRRLDAAARQQTEAPQDDTKSFLGAETCINATLYFKDDLYYIINEDDIKNGDYSLGTGISYTNDGDIMGGILNNLRIENIKNIETIESIESILKFEYKIIPIGKDFEGGGKYNLKTKCKEILGKKMRIYKIANSRKEHVKYKCNIITLAEYRKLMKKKSNSKKVLKAKKAVVANKK